MRARVPIAALAALLVAVTVAAGASAKPAPTPGQTAAPTDVRAAFFTNWSRYARGYFVKQIPADKLNVLDYAFGAPTAAGTCGLTDPWSDYEAPTGADQSVDGVADDSANPNQHLYGNFNQLLKLKAAHPNLRVVMSLGGWTGSKYFSDVAATAATRQAFVASCVDLLLKGNLPFDPATIWPPSAGGPGAAAGVFDGIDIDWEYPGIDPGNGADHSPADVHNATLLLQEFRRQLDAYGATTGKHYLLTADLPAGNVNSSGSWELAPVSRTVDWINLLTFDFHGSWDAWTDFNSPFSLDPKSPAVPGALMSTWSTAGTVDYYLANGVSPDKLVVGVPFYGKEYVGVPGINNGLFQPHARGAVERLADLPRPRRHRPRRRQPDGDRSDGGLADVEHRQRRHGPERLHALLRRRGEGAVALQPDAVRRHVHQLRRPTCRGRPGTPREAGQAPRPLGLGNLERRRRRRPDRRTLGAVASPQRLAP